MGGGTIHLLLDLWSARAAIDADEVRAVLASVPGVVSVRVAAELGQAEELAAKRPESRHFSTSAKPQAAATSTSHGILTGVPSAGSIKSRSVF
jgi:hypothetical protein